MAPKRRTGFAGGAKGGGIESSRGRATAAPMPRRMARRDRDLLVMNILRRAPLLEWNAVDDTEDDGRETVVRRMADDLADHGHVVRLEAAAECVGHQLLGHGTDEDFRLLEK